MRRSAHRPFFLILALAVCLFWLWPNSEIKTEEAASPPSVATSEEHDPETSTQRNDIANSDTTITEAPPTQTDSSPDKPLSILAKVPQVYGAGITSLTARVGLAYVDEADAASWRDDESERGAIDYFELANVRDWLEASLDGRGYLGPVPVPIAEAYRIVAWSNDGDLYFKEHVPVDATRLKGERDVGELSRFEATGIIVDLPKDLRNQAYRLQVQRLADDTIHPLKHILNHAFPDVANAYDGKTWELDASNRLAPLFPDAAIRLTLIDALGNQGQPRDVALTTGTMTTWRPDGGALPKATAGRALRGRIVWDINEPLPTSLELDRLGRDDESFPVDSEGNFYVSSVSKERTTRFRLRGLPFPTEDTRPVVPDTAFFIYEPHESDGSLVEVTWEVPVYRWLLLGLDQNEHERLKKRSARGYPVFVLQKEHNNWQTIGSDVFRQEPRHMAVSINQPGTYRVITALSPLFQVTSHAVAVKAIDTEVSLPLPTMPEQIRYELICISAENGQPLIDAPALVVGQSPGLPPIRTFTDAKGRIDLGPVNTQRFLVSIGDREQEVIVNEHKTTSINIEF